MLIGITTTLEKITNYDNINIFQVFYGDAHDPKYNRIYLKKFDAKKLIIVHSKYCYNISKKNIYYPIMQELSLLKKLNIDSSGIIIHLSKFYTKTREEGLIDVSQKLNDLIEKLFFNKTNNKLIIETSYEITHLGSTLEDLFTIWKNIKKEYKDWIKFCIDTSHIFLAGYPINSYVYLVQYLYYFHKNIGIENIFVVHLNDINSFIWGNHTSHLSIIDKNGKIFNLTGSSESENINLQIIINICNNFNIPIILERTSDKYIFEEINYLCNLKLIFTYSDILIIFKLLEIMEFLKLLINYYTIYEKEDYVKIIKKFMNNILLSYMDKSNFKLIKINNHFKFDHDIEGFFFSKYIKTILNNDNNLEIFEKYENNPTYKIISNLIECKFIGIQTAKLLIENNINSLEELQKLSLYKKKKLLTKPQITSLKFYKLIKHISLDVAEEIIKILDFYFQTMEHYYLGSYFRYKKYGQFKLIKDLDLLVIGNQDLLINFLLDQKVCKAVLLNGDSHKSFICKYKTNIYFILEIFFCSQDEKIPYIIYLKGPVKKNIFLRHIAKSKGYILTSTSIKRKNDDMPIILKTEEELYNLLNIDYQKYQKKIF